MRTNDAGSHSRARTVGIMVCPGPGEPPFAEKQFFRSLCLIGKHLGLVVFVFFPYRVDWRRKRTIGYSYSVSARRWIKGVFPLPDAVYDRCFYSKPSTYFAYRPHIRRLMERPGTRFLGYGLKGKWSVHQQLSLDEKLRPHLPETEPLGTTSDMMRWLDDKGELFLKPHAGTHGKGVLHIAADGNGRFVVKGRDARNEPVGRLFRTQHQLLAWVAGFTRGRKYLMQRYLNLSTGRGDVFDIRVLVQKNREGRWEVTGIAVRQGAPGSITSNLHGGGHAEEAEPFLRGKYGDATNGIIETIRSVALRVPAVLEQTHGRLVELGVDLGVDDQGRVWVLEANSKPGRSAFAELSDKRARMASVRNPLLYASFLLNGPSPSTGR